MAAVGRGNARAVAPLPAAVYDYMVYGDYDDSVCPSVRHHHHRPRIENEY